MTNKKLILTIALSLVVLVVLFPAFASALTVKSVSADSISPGQQGTIKIELENELNDPVEIVSFKLDFTNLPISPVGNSEDSIDEINDGDEEEFTFLIKSANDITPGDYKIPYSITYNFKDKPEQKSGFIGITIKANAELSFSLETEKPILGKQDKLTLKIINKGFADAKFVSVKIIPEGFNVLSDKEIYIGTIDSDDFETTAFDVIYQKLNPILTTVIEYKDFDNKNMIKSITLPITVYTPEKAIELGLISKNNTPLYATIIISLILIFILYRVIKRKMRQAKRNKSAQV